MYGFLAQFTLCFELGASLCAVYETQGLFKDMVLHLGFTVEGRAADELPESLLACSTLHYPMMERAVEFDV